MKTIIFDSDNLIYNRFDLIHDYESVETAVYEENGRKYEIHEFNSDGVVELDIWGKCFPQSVFENIISDVFHNKRVYAIRVTRGRNQFASFLGETNDIRVPLPDSFDELLNRTERRDRATIRRKLRWLNERIGALTVNVYANEDIPDSIVDTYFKWKKETHGTEYSLTSKEYLDKYYVTDAMLMKSGTMDVAVAFFCQVEDIVFFENFSYNAELKEYSPGLLMYVKFMEELIRRKCRYMYLGGGSYVYKKRFGSEISLAYSGMIYRQEIVDGLNLFFKEKGIQTVAFYGYGVCGHSFLQLSTNLNLFVSYGIDRNRIDNINIEMYLPEEHLPAVDAVLITLNNKNEEVEHFLNNHFLKVYYWNDILDKVINDYYRSIDETT